MMNIPDTARRAVAMVLAVSMTLSTLPMAFAKDPSSAQTPPAQEELHEDTPILPVSDPEEDGLAVLPLLPEEDDGTALPILPEDETDTPIEGGTPMITWPDPNETEDESTSPSPDPSYDVDVYAPSSHTHKWTESLRIPATCENDGSVIYTCPGYSYKLFGKTYHIYCTPKKETLKKLGHKWGDWVVDQKFPCVTGTRTRVCKNDSSHTQTESVSAVDHLWDDGTVEQAYPCVSGTRTYHCTRGCGATKTETVEPSTEHNYTWVETKKPSCTEAGEEVQVCSVCGGKGMTRPKSALGGEHDLTHIVEDETCTADGKEYDTCARCGYTYNEVVRPQLGHKWDDGTVEQAHPCVSGTKTYHCVNGSCTETKSETVEPTAEHTAGTWTDTDQPGCCEQVFTTNCTVCGGKMTKTSPAIRNHKFSQVDNYRWEGSLTDGKYVIDYICDYCGATKSTTSTMDSLLATGVDSGADHLAGEATTVIQDVLKNTRDEVNKAETKEEAVAALDKVHDQLVEELMRIAKVKVGDTEIGITAEMADALLKSLGVTSVLDEVKNELGDSFLSKESLQASVSKIVDTTISKDATAATKKTAHDVLFSEIYKLLDKKDLAPEYDSSVSGLILQMAQTAAKDDAYWDELTESLFDDALKEAMDALKTSKKYKKYTNNKLFDEMFDEMSEIVREQLINDPAFMSEVRGIVETAAANAKKGVDLGWSEEKIYANLRKDLNSVNDLVTRQITALGGSSADYAEDKVSSTIQKFLPYNLLGLWFGDTLGGVAKDLVDDAIETANSSISKTIDSYIKYYTCPSHDWQPVVVNAATCTSPAKTSDQCSKCGWRKSSKDDSGEALGHDPVTDPAVEPSQLATGKTEGSHCSRCGEVFIAQQDIPMLDPTIYAESKYHHDITEEDAIAVGYASADELNAALDAALRDAGFDPANSIRFAAQVDSSIGILLQDRFPTSGTEVLLSIPDTTATDYYAVQVFTADTVLHTTGELLATPVKQYANKIGVTLYTQAIIVIAWN